MNGRQSFLKINGRNDYSQHSREFDDGEPEIPIPKSFVVHSNT